MSGKTEKTCVECGTPRKVASRGTRAIAPCVYCNDITEWE